MQSKITVTILILLGIFGILFYKFSDQQEKIVIGEIFGDAESSARKHVFIDLGGNIGDSAKYFVDKDPATTGIKGYASRDESIKWEIHVVEANPYFNKHLDELKVYCEKMGHKVFLYKQTAAWIKNEKLTFYLDTVNPKHNYWGSSLIKEHPDVKKSNFSAIELDGLDVSELLGKYNENDEIILKMDIEGTEYKLLTHLLQQKTLYLIDSIAVEFHSRFLAKEESQDLDSFFLTCFKILGIKFFRWG